MEILKIFKGGFINKEPVIGNDSINSQIQDNITNITFNKDEYIFNEKLKVKLNYELILKNIKSKIDESILELQLKNKEITDFLSANPDTEDEILLEKTKDEFKVLIIKKDKNSDDESRQLNLLNFCRFCRLFGNLNSIHAAPDVDQAGGFERPIFYRLAAVEPNATSITSSFSDLRRRHGR